MFNRCFLFFIISICAQISFSAEEETCEYVKSDGHHLPVEISQIFSIFQTKIKCDSSNGQLIIKQHTKYTLSDNDTRVSISKCHYDIVLAGVMITDFTQNDDLGEYSNQLGNTFKFLNDDRTSISVKLNENEAIVFDNCHVINDF